MKHWLEATPLVWLLMAAPAATAPTIQEFTIPTAGAQPQELVLGPDGSFDSVAAST